MLNPNTTKTEILRLSTALHRRLISRGSCAFLCVLVFMTTGTTLVLIFSFGCHRQPQHRGGCSAMGILQCSSFFFYFSSLHFFLLPLHKCFLVDPSLCLPLLFILHKKNYNYDTIQNLSKTYFILKNFKRNITIIVENTRLNL